MKKSIPHAILTAFAAGALALASGGAAAQSAQQVCKPDIEKFCANVPQGEGRIAQCLRGHQQQLSPACQHGMMQTATLMKEVAGACEDDLHRYCAGAAPGTVKECLRSHFRELSPTCKRELIEAKRGM